MATKKTTTKKATTPKATAKKATAKKATAKPAAGKSAGAKADGKPKKLSAIDVAAKVLAESKEPMSAKQMIEAMAAKKYWTSPGGKTPWATLYSAILRSVNKDGKESRFKKAERESLPPNSIQFRSGPYSSEARAGPIDRSRRSSTALPGPIEM